MKIHVLHILTEQKYELEDVQKKLKEGESFEDLARKFSKCPSGARGGDLGEVEATRFVAPFSEAACELKPGAVSGVVQTQFGYHLIKRLS